MTRKEKAEHEAMLKQSAKQKKTTRERIKQNVQIQADKLKSKYTK